MTFLPILHQSFKGVMGAAVLCVLIMCSICMRSVVRGSFTTTLHLPQVKCGPTDIWNILLL